MYERSFPYVLNDPIPHLLLMKVRPMRKSETLVLKRKNGGEKRVHT